MIEKVRALWCRFWHDSHHQILRLGRFGGADRMRAYWKCRLCRRYWTQTL